jgi:20S proteasome alpha/beta subunit
MGTVVAVEADAGVVVAGDTRTGEDGVVSSDRFRRVFDVDGVGVGVAGAAGPVQEFRRQLAAAIRDRQFETDGGPDIDAVGRIAARTAQGASVDAVVAGRDTSGVPRIRQVDADGSVLAGPAVALGSGARIALGQLEAISPTGDIDDLAATARSVVASTMERDADTGGDVDTWTLADGDARRE